jgi:hypothetical protein
MQYHHVIKVDKKGLIAVILVRGKAKISQKNIFKTFRLNAIVKEA